MTCADLDCLKDHATGITPAAEVEAHPILCGECLADFAMIRLLRATFLPKENGFWDAAESDRRMRLPHDRCARALRLPLPGTVQ